ncbi:endonuclease/exonuclease/phosphatase family protein [Antarctobacter jejuensis]|uniref:endonuclease/exonuclease/phosphatase family protein n=1 Tax=Antarctobacter jejuensis TaxID=1439938 RepID=UPI003FD20362
MRAAVRLIAALSGLLLLTGCAAPSRPPHPAPDALRIATHNVHFIRMTKARGPWSLSDWEDRKHALDAVFKETDADLVAFQEMVSIGPDDNRDVNLARDWLLSRNPGYGVAASGDWRRFPTRQPIFYRTDRLRLRDHGWFFHDPPDVVAREKRRRGFWIYHATWAEFEDRGGQVFRVYNVHFHFFDALKRRHAAARVADHAAPALADGMPVIVMGDTNSFMRWTPVRTLQRAGLTLTDPNGASFHFNRGLHLLPALDRILHSPQVTVLNGPWAVRGRRAGDWPSDHYPVVADIRLP